MALTVTEADEATACTYCPAVVSLDEARRDSDGRPCCETCYSDGTAYVEPLDYELDGGR